MDAMRDWETCNYSRRNLTRCGKRADVVVDYAGGTGVCVEHVGQVVLWCMGKNGPGELPDQRAEVWPTYRWATERNE